MSHVNNSKLKTQNSKLIISSISLHYHYQRVLQDLSLQLEAGTITALIGPNGAGKTSLLHVLSGTRMPSHGQVLLNDRDLAKMSAAERARQIAVVPQIAQLPEGFTVAEIVLLGRSPHLPRFGAEGKHDYEATEQAMRLTETLELAQRPGLELSGGERQRVLLARALAQQPQVLLLDEVTAHLDLKYQISSLELARDLARQGLIVLAVLHDLNLAATYADRILLMNKGQLVADGTAQEVLKSSRILEVYGIDTIISQHPQTGRPLVIVEGSGVREQSSGNQ